MVEEGEEEDGRMRMGPKGKVEEIQEEDEAGGRGRSGRRRSRYSVKLPWYGPA